MGCGSAKGVSPVTVEKSLKWGQNGRVKIMSVKFKAVYNPTTQEIDIELSNNQVVESVLSWNSLAVTLFNVKAVDYETNEEFALPPMKLQFLVSPEGRFLKLLNEAEIVKSTGDLQGRQSLSEPQKSLLLKTVQAETSVLWKNIYEHWLDTALRSNKTESYKKPSITREKTTVSNQSELEKFLTSKYPGELLTIEGATVEEFVAATLEEATMRPHKVRTRKSRYLIFHSPVRNVIEMSEEVGMHLFCWEDLPNLAAGLKQEFDKLTKGISEVLDNFSLTVSAYKHI